MSYVVLRSGTSTSAEEILRYCVSVLPAFKAPTQIVLSDQLPRSERGKLDRKALLEKWTRDGEKQRKEDD